MSESVLVSQKTDQSDMVFSAQKHHPGEGVEATRKDKTNTSGYSEFCLSGQCCALSTGASPIIEQSSAAKPRDIFTLLGN